MIVHSIKKAFKKGRKRGWHKLFVAVDIHDTIVIGKYDKNKIDDEFLPGALEALQYLSKRKDIVLIIYTCCHQSELIKYHQFFQSQNINFDYCNENPEVETTTQGLGSYDKKMYFDILFEDKGGFVPETEWRLALEAFKSEPLLTDKSTYSIKHQAVTPIGVDDMGIIHTGLSWDEATETCSQYNQDREGWYSIIKEPPIRQSKVLIDASIDEFIQKSNLTKSCNHNWRPHGRGFECITCHFYTGMNFALNTLINQELHETTV